MPRRCTICHHPQHEEIAVSLFRNGTRATARRFQVSLPALDRHKGHLPDGIVKARQTELECAATLKVKSHPAVSCAIYTRHCSDVCEAAWKLHHEQRDACKAFVASERQHGWRALPTRYIDRDSSLSILQTSSLRRLLRHVQKGMIHVVVVYRLEHLSANLPELAKIIELLYQHKVSLVSLIPRLNTNEPAGQLAVSLLLSFARFETKLNADPQAKVAPMTPPKMPLCGSQPPKYEKFLQNSQRVNSEARHTIRTEFLVLGPGRKKAFLSWARNGFVCKGARSQCQNTDSAKTA